jgi:hypothetical protein
MSKVISKRSDQFSETTIDDEVIVMHLSSGEFFSLTGTGRSLWLLIDGTRDHSALLAAAAAQYGVEPADIADDVDSFLTQLGAAGFLDAG